MHKEVVVRRKVFAVTISLIFLTLALYIYEWIELLKVSNIILLNSIKIILSISTIIILVIECNKCSISYKYSIIADKLIINKIKNNREQNVESIKIKNIIYIGRKKDIPKNIKKEKKLANYLCNKFSKNKYTCIYKNGEEIFRFNFQPSECFIERVKNKM